jgi:hypothetical protein
MMDKSTALPVELLGVENQPRWRKLCAKFSCAIFGHRVSNAEFAATASRIKHCRCGTAYLHESGETTRVSHTVSCFLFGHHYIWVGERDGHHEYVCRRCGHPLLFGVERDPYEKSGTFKKKVRYLCNLFGHRVHQVSARHGLTEYACDCGHSFLKLESSMGIVKHPLVCFFAGHNIRFIERRRGYGEYLCRHCGHTFYFVVNH